MKLELLSWYRVLAPRPVVLISTVDLEGVSNAAPFSFVMPVSGNPPLIAFASSANHDTVKNILKTKDFVVNIPGREILEQLWICADDFPAGISEIEKSGLTEETSIKVKSPRIGECFAHFECELVRKYPEGDHLLIIGKILEADIKDEFMDGKKYLIARANPLTHITGDEFGLFGKIIRV